MSRSRLDASSGKPARSAKGGKAAGSGVDTRSTRDSARRADPDAGEGKSPAPDSTIPDSPVLDSDVEHQLSRLESQLTDVLEAYRRLQIENRSLRAHQTRMIEERARLVEKNETARTKVEQMIMRLKSLEAGQQ